MGLSTPQVNVLRLLRDGVTENLNARVLNGLVIMSLAEYDGRTFQWRITEKGREALIRDSGPPP
jgi:DNA-binding MarR family transcriptional regulator